MELRVLGCWAPYPRPGGACSGYLLQSGEASLMLDIGNGSFAELIKHIEYPRLTGLIITHFHPDHYVDLFCLRHAVEGAIRNGKLNGRLKLFLPAEPRETYNTLAEYTKAFNIININDLPENEDFLIPGVKKYTLDVFELLFVPTIHSMPGYSLLVKTRDGTLFYSGDTGLSPVLSRFAYKADLFLCEASGFDKDALFLSGLHLTSRQAGEVASLAEVKKLVLTHFWPEYDPKELMTQAREAFQGNIDIARQGKLYII